MNVLAISLAQAATQPDVTLSVAGAAIMIVSVGLVLGLNVFCMLRILRAPGGADRHHVPLDIDTRDTD